MEEKITLELTPKQAEVLAEALLCVEDDGPYGMGWASDPVIELREFIDNVINKHEDKIRAKLRNNEEVKI